ncbi:MAG: hypothetical protein AAF791_04955 [Bacteroidota bacterium]
MPRLALLASVLSLLLVTGCDSGSSDLFGEFIADVTVDGVRVTDPDDDPDDDETPEDLTGEAVYTVVQTENGPEFVLGLFVGDLFDSQYDDYQYVLFRLAGGVPSVGAYGVAEDPERTAARALYADVLDGDDPEEATGQILNGTDGVLALSSVDPYSIVGTFNFDARGVDVQNAQRIVRGRMSGQFEAVYEQPSLVLNRGLDLR